MIASKYSLYDSSFVEELFLYSAKIIEVLYANNKISDGQRIALEWAEEISDRLELERTDNWKFFKRNLLSKWFNKPESKRFLPGWEYDEVRLYINSFKGKTLRVSKFPNNIACHSESIILSNDIKNKWHGIISEIDNSIPIEIFPESSSKKSICFRRYSTAFNEEVIYEASLGQATYAFESANGSYPIVSATKSREKYLYNNRITGKHKNKYFLTIRKKLQKLIDLYDWSLSTKSFGICRSLGMDWIAIEGYYEVDKSNDMIVVDIDIPFDFIFMLK
ncbi:MAG: hypothetical protein ABR936_07120 [Bacteroidota bacterium]|jgi:hypothetical protein